MRYQLRYVRTATGNTPARTPTIADRAEPFQSG